MMQEEEKGFLAHKFEDWGSEPIPNGWGKINEIIDHDRRSKYRALWLVLPFLLLVGGSTIYFSTIKGRADQEVVNAEGINDGTPHPLDQDEKGLQKVDGISAITTGDLLQKQSSKANKPGIDLTSTDLIVKSQYATTAIPNERLKKQRKTKGKIGSQVLIARVEQHQVSKGAFIVIGNSLVKASTYIGETMLSESNLTSNQYNHTDSESSLLLLGNGNGPENAGLDAVASMLLPTSRLENRQDNMFMDGKSANLFGIEEPIRPILFPAVVSDFPITSVKKRLKYSFGFVGGFAPRSIQIDQAQSSNYYKISESNNSSESWFGCAGLEVQSEVTSWLRSFGSVSFGLFKQEINFKTTSKEPESYRLTSADNKSYLVQPNWIQQNEKRRQDLIFGTMEFGLKPLLFKASESGPFASAVVWMRLSQTYTSSLGADAAPFENTNESVALSYRLGYQHVFNRKIRAEIFTAGMPDKILASTKGLSVKPQLLGIGLRYILN